MKRILGYGATSMRALVCAGIGVALIAACDSRRAEPAGAPPGPPAPAVTSTAPPAAPPAQSGSGGQDSQAGSTRPPSPSRGGQGAVSAADVAFVASAASAGTLEVEASRVALEKTKSAAVRSFAQKMVDEHSKVGAELRALTVAASVGNVAAMTPTDGAQLRKLQELQGRDFDREYVATMGVAAHEDAVNAFEKAAESASDPQLKTFAQAKLPALREHLKMAQALAKQVGASAAAPKPDSLARSK